MVGANPAATAINVLTSPAEAFAALRDRPTFLFPLAAILALIAATMLLYYSSVDIAWLMDLSLPPESPNMSAEQRESAIEQMSSLPPLMLGSFAAASTVFVITAWLLLFAAYLRLLSAMRHDDFRFKQWFSLVCWCSIVLLVTQFATIANMYYSDVEFLRPDRLNPLSLASLLELDGLDSNAANRAFTMIDLGAIWATILLLVGYRQWTAVSWPTATAVVLGPLAMLGAGFYIFAR